MVAMPVVGMVKVAIDQVIDVVAVRHGLVSAPRTVDMVVRMRVADVTGRALGGVVCVDLQDVLVHMVFVGMVEVTVMEIVDVTAVADGHMAAALSVSMIVVGVNVVIAHESFSGGIGSSACWSALRMSSRTWSSTSE